jgi:hypothetical protein
MKAKALIIKDSGTTKMGTTNPAVRLEVISKEEQEYRESKRRIKSMVGDLNEIKMDLKSMLDWSDRIGSDERHQLNQTISVINRSLRKIK